MTNRPTHDQVIRLLADRVRAARADLTLSQEALAERAGLHRNEISNLERAVNNGGREANPRLSTVVSLAAALDVPLSDLLT
ncbi:helix-turn-helix domain-containing protein [Gordonia sihwensis]|uniref:helix-turn-helix domain-containing protein n=1 Tax=Gordonia sihwensis TaxID=173559 RepID=UPI003D9912AE